MPNPTTTAEQAPPVTALRREMTRAGVSVRKLAAASKISKSTINGYLLGQVASPNPSTQQALLEAAAGFGISLDKPWALVQAPLVPRASSRPRKREAWRKPVSQQPTEPGQEEPMIPSKIYLDPDELEYFQLREDPFDEQRGTWQPPRFKYNRRCLIRSIERREIVALVGEVGAGESTLLRTLHSQADASSARVKWMTPGNLDRGGITEGALAIAMLRDLGKGDLSATSAERRGNLLREELGNRVAEGEWPVLAIDEAHDLSAAGLIAIKRIWDSFTFNRSLSVILAGQLPLKLRLQGDRTVREVTGRTRLLEIPSLKAEDVRDYLAFRLRAVGADAAGMFEPDAYAAILRRGGVGPLWVDAIAAQSMRAAFLRHEKRISAALVARC